MPLKSTYENMRKEKRRRANGLMKRWAYFTLEGADDLGYPHQSPEQERVKGIDCMRVANEKKTPEDILTEGVIESLDKQRQELARLCWRKQCSYSEIAVKLQLKDKLNRVSKYRARAQVKAILDMVADKVLM